MSEQGRVTLRTIASRAGVHVSTVSRVLHASDQEDVARAASAVTRERIRSIADELGYRPNPLATGLRTRRSNIIGVLVPRLSDIVLATIYEGIEAAAATTGMSTFVANTGDEPQIQQARTDLLLSRLVDGVIFADAHLDGGFLATVAARDIPFVLVNRRAADFPAVTIDDRAGGRLVAEHLIEAGHEDVGVVAGPPFASTGVDRTAGFVDHYRERGIRIPSDRVVRSAFDTAGGREATQQLLAHRNPPTAIFAVNDFAAIGAMGALRDHGLQVGTDVAVVGYNDIPLAAELPVPLTSVRTSLHEMGSRALHLMRARLDGDLVESEMLVPTLMIRESSTRTSSSTGTRRGVVSSADGH